MATQTDIITGRLVYGDGNVAASAPIQATRIQDPITAAAQAVTDVGSATTDSSGYFALSFTRTVVSNAGVVYKLVFPDGSTTKVYLGAGQTLYALGTLTIGQSPVPNALRDQTVAVLANQRQLATGVLNSVTGLSIEYSMGAMVLRMTSMPVTVANTTGASFGSKKLFTYPQGRIYHVGGTVNLSFNWAGQDIAQDGSGDFSLGTTATADATLNSTDVDLLASTAMTDPFVSGVGVGTGNLVAAAFFDGTGTAKEMHLNMIIDDADVEDAASDIVLVTGTITQRWDFLGDY